MRIRECLDVLELNAALNSRNRVRQSAEFGSEFTFIVVSPFDSLHIQSLAGLKIVDDVRPTSDPAIRQLL